VVQMGAFRWWIGIKGGGWGCMNGGCCLAWIGRYICINWKYVRGGRIRDNHEEFGRVMLG